MTDKERILMTIIHRLSLTQCLGPGRAWGEEAFCRDGGTPLVHFAPWVELRPGMLVLCKTSAMRSVHDWTISYLVRPIGDAAWVLREIGTDRLCNMTNESFEPIIGLSSELLHEREGLAFVKKVKKAFGRLDNYTHRYSGVTFDATAGTASIWVREVFGGSDGTSKPYAIVVTWNKRTSISAICNTMIEQGYGTREFETNKP